MREPHQIVTEAHNPFPCPTSLERVLLRALASIGRQCYELGWCPGTAGNFSLRGSRGLCWVSRTGIGKARLGADDFVPIWLATGSSVMPGASAASLEAAVHLAIYGLRPEARAVVHAHPPATVARSVMHEVLEFKEAEMQKALGAPTHLKSVGIPVIANPATISLGEMVAALQPLTNLNYGALVLRGHGTYAWGETPEAAMDRIEALEFLCQTSV
ncbi:MAG: methylthioribulose-1-phosphate dehydratase [Deltaproteobacteria bacterium]|nr:methylthioribulose-1-phosphate dehydratase [Deltaproteobacteria bacterium]